MNPPAKAGHHWNTKHRQLNKRSRTFAARVRRSPLSPTLMFNTSFSTRICRIGFLGRRISIPKYQKYKQKQFNDWLKNVNGNKKLLKEKIEPLGFVSHGEWDRL